MKYPLEPLAFQRNFQDAEINRANTTKNDDLVGDVAKDQPEPGVTRKRWYLGYSCVRKDPYGLWSVSATEDGKAIPTALSGLFTSENDLRRAIELHEAHSGGGAA